MLLLFTTMSSDSKTFGTALPFGDKQLEISVVCPPKRDCSSLPGDTQRVPRMVCSTYSACIYEVSLLRQATANA